MHTSTITPQDAPRAVREYFEVLDDNVFVAASEVESMFSPPTNGQQQARVTLSAICEFDPCCTLHEWLVFPLRGGTELYATAAFSTLRAHAAGKPNSQNGLVPVICCDLRE